MNAVNAVGVPRFRLLKRAEEHLVEPQRVGTITLHNVVWVDNVVECLTHLLNSVAAFIDRLAFRCTCGFVI